ncbi:MAG: pyridoxal-phosphate dependent enzyme [Roseobacter sp.]|jgi:diaminopropionate ammonia-lyase|nr:pyridoxal-phosphate dependent enzyme [Roseobacter sp.]
MKLVSNDRKPQGLTHPALADIPWAAADAAPPRALFAGCPHADETPLVQAPGLADQLGVGQIYLKDERARMGLGSFKALGAAYVIACDAADGRAAGKTYVTASAGNHGLSLAAGAAAFGASARVYIAQSVPEAFAERLRGLGAVVVRAGEVYEESMAAAAQAAEQEGLILLSDSSWSGYTARPHRLMEGYLILMAEAVAQIPEPPTHIFLQAGVGGLAGACAAHARAVWGDTPLIVVVEPEEAPALAASMTAQAPVVTRGAVSAMGRLDCKEPSLIALKSLARDADVFMTITEEEGLAGARRAEAAGFASTPSGAAGLAGVMAAGDGLGLTAGSRVLLILSEAA